MNPELERLLALVSKVSQGLGEKITMKDIAQLTGGRLYEKREGSVIEDGEIKDLIQENLKLFSCGHIASGNRDIFGSVCCSPVHDYRNLPVLDKNLDPATPFIGCRKCMKRCIRCKKLFCLFCITTVQSLPGIVFCKRCAGSRKWEDFFGFFFGRR